MKTYQEVLDRLKNELNQWQIRQGNDLYSDFYLYYLPSTVEHDSGLIICKEQPANPDYRLVTAERIKKEFSIQYNFQYFERFLRNIPVLDLDREV